MAWFSHKRWEKSDNILGIIFTAVMDVQLLVGLALYFFISPITKAAFQNIGAAMKNPELRFYLVEHFLLMLIAVVLVHIGRSKSKKASSPRKKFGVALVFFGIAYVLLLVGIPWGRVII
jgi:dipeptide/tripeptide permease